MKNDINMLWRLFATYLPDEEYQYIVDQEGNSQQVKVSAQDFAAENRAYPVADPRVITKQDRISSSQSFLQMVTQTPQLGSNPQIVDWSLRNCLTAMDLHEVLGMLPPPPPPPQPPPPIPQTDENAAFLKGQQPQVNPADNDGQHLMDMSTFRSSPEFMAMTPEQVSSFEQHGRNHIAAKMQKESKQNAAPQRPSPVPGMATVGSDAGLGLLSP